MKVTIFVKVNHNIQIEVEDSYESDSDSAPVILTLGY